MDPLRLDGPRAADDPASDALRAAATEIHERAESAERARINRAFVPFVLGQVVLLVVLALVVSPRTWIGETGALHVHVWSTALLGFLIAAGPIIAVWRAPASRTTPLIVGIAQMCISSLLIHVTGGRIESHFHIFGSLAFLAFYREARVVLIPAAIVAVDHMARGLMWPASIFGPASVGGWRWLEHAVYVVFECVVLLLHIRITRRDALESAWREARLEEAQAQLGSQLQVRTQELNSYQTAVDAAAGLMVCDLTGTIRDINVSLLDAVGFTRTDLIDHSITCLEVDGDGEPDPMASDHDRIGVHRLGDGLEAVGLGAPRWRQLVQARGGDGATRWLDVTMVPIVDGGETPRQCLVACIDLTPRREAERRLAAAMAAVRRADAAKTAFLTNMSHEIRTPLTSVLGFAELIAESAGEDERPDPADTREHMTALRAHASRLLDLVNDVLDLSSLEADRFELDPVDMRPTEVLQDVVNAIRPRAEEKGLQIDVVVAGPLPSRIRSDPGRVRQVLGHLLANAVTYTSRGGVTLAVDHDPESSRLRFDVIDTGEGIPADFVPRLFDAFTQVDESVTRRHEGAGLGLRISRTLARAMGGDIHVETELGRGSRFIATIRADRSGAVRMLNADEARRQILGEVATDGAAVPESAGASVDPAQRLMGARILVAEDGPDNQRLLRFILEKAGAEVLVVENGALAVEAIASAGDAPFDLLVSDMQMPEMDGYVAARTLRERGAELPIIALTAHAMPEDRERCLEAGCDEYLTKPIDRRVLLGACERWLAVAATNARRAA